jgi:hypothetical protein
MTQAVIESPRGSAGRLLGVWQRFWFSPHPALDLALCRIAFFGFLYQRYDSYNETAWYTLKQGGVWYPVSFFNLGVPVFEPDTLRFIYWLMGLSLLCAALGLFSRVSMALSFITALYTFALQQNFAKYTGGGIDVVVVVMGGFALSRAGDDLSLDRFFRLLREERGHWRKTWAAFTTPVAPSGEYLWPLKFAWLMFYMLYFSAGISKLMHSGLGWADSENLRNSLIRHHFSHEPPTDWGLWVADRTWAYKGMGYASLGIEVFAPLGLFFRPLRIPFALALGGMQYGIYLLLGVTFAATKALLLMFVPWSGLLKAARRVSTARRRAGTAGS